MNEGRGTTGPKGFTAEPKDERERRKKVGDKELEILKEKNGTRAKGGVGREKQV